MEKELKMLCKVRNTLLPDKGDSFIGTMISLLDSKINSIQKETTLEEDTTEVYKKKQTYMDYNKSDQDCRNLQVYSYEFVRGKIRKKFPDTLKTMTEALVKSYRSRQYLATEDPSESDYWYDCHCVAGENPFDNLENCRTHWMRENREDGFDASYWWRKEPTLYRKISRLKKEIKKERESHQKALEDEDVFEVVNISSDFDYDDLSDDGDEDSSKQSNFTYDPSTDYPLNTEGMPKLPMDRLEDREVNGVKFTMVKCPAGEFMMGGDGTYDGKPKHRVKITKPFFMGQTQVTQALWEAVMGSNPSYFRGSTLPVEQVNWFDCVRFCNALSKAESLEPVYSIGSGDELTVSLDLGRNGYRLPTEAEFEYAAKAGTDLTYAGSNNVDEVAWYEVTTNDEGTRPVGQKKPNSWGLYDMSGNVWEWCSDQWKQSAYQGRTETTRDPHEWVGSASLRVKRGGNWDVDADLCRVAYRSGGDADCRVDILGFRFLRVEP